ncbi:AbrB family transcriptional regulator [Gemmobacter denitrificans]|uniref:AbrB family transcriptional regulator n=1 Tax=Gemmobacter denitrificans TaxID=3123040 RepID=A0ABU8BXV6_9RHOB
MAPNRTILILQNTLALVIGTAGGGLFWWLHMPLPWMLGALTATMIGAVSGLPLRGPQRIRGVVVAVIGVLLGASFTPALIGQAGAWALSFAGLLAYLALSLVILIPLFRRLGGFDRPTAFLAAMPGGLTEMIELAEAARADVPKVILAQSLRIVTTIALIALWFRVVQGLAVGQAPLKAGFADLAWRDMGWLAGAALVGTGIGLWLRLPAPTLLGPMLVSALLHLTAITESAPPGELVIAAQVILGTLLGCRFTGIRAAALLPALALSLGATLVMLAIALGFALSLQALTGQSADQLLLAYAPGGLTEMSLVALALQAEVAFVAAHHVLRILVVIVAAPLLFRLWQR